VDEAGNRSGLSNVVEFTTAAEPLGWWPGFEGQTPNGAVRALHVLGDTLYVGGSFVSVGEVATRALAKWDGASWSGYGSALVGGNHGTMVFNMADLGGQLYVGGSIGTAGGAPANNLARWTGTAWESLGVSRTKGYPWSMGVYDGELYVGWVYNMSSTWPFEKLTRYDGTQFHGMGWDEDDSGLAEDMQVHDGKLFMCGGFQTGQGLATAGIIAWDGLEYSTPSSPLSGGYWNEPYPTAMCVYRGDLYVAGEFTHAGGRQVNHIARWDGNAWYPVGAGLSGERPMVHAMTVYRDHLVVAGTFEGAGGQPAANIAMWDGSYWIPLGSGLENDEGFIGVEALAVFQGSLYAGGNFTWAGGHHSPNIARWDFD
jgi:hypothetical protein